MNAHNPRAVASLPERSNVIAFPAANVPCIDPSAKGLIPLYECGMACPGCRWRCWHVGRLLAECAHCGVALARGDTSTGGGLFVSRGRQ